MMRRATTALVAVLMLLTLLGNVGCSEDESADESTDELVAQLAIVTEERDALLASAAQQQERHDRAQANLDEINAMLNNPESFGSEEELVALIAEHATPTAQLDDDVFGAVNYREGFYNTLFGGTVDARIDTFDSWVSADGTQGGVLWIWYGTNAAGNPFELVGISLQEFDEDGRITYELVTYPYSNSYVREAFMGGGTPTPSTGPTTG